MKIVIDKNIPFLEGVFEPFATVEYLDGRSIDAAAVEDANALIVRTRTKCNRELLEGSKVEMIATATIGYDHIDTDYLRSRGIDFVTAAGCNAAGVLQYVATALVWIHNSLKEIDPSQTTLGIVGVGNVGSLIKWMGEKCGFRVLCCDPPKQDSQVGGDYVDLDTLLHEADIITCHVPLIAQGKYKTLGMASESFFDKMKTEAIFINSSRGEVVDDAALCRVIDGGKLRAVVIDTWNGEPNICKELLEKANLSTPHIAGYSLQGKANGSSMAVREVARKFGLPLEDWYPEGIEPRPEIENLSWEWLMENAPRNFDIEAQSQALKAHSEGFEAMRNNYNYRIENF